MGDMLGASSDILFVDKINNADTIPQTNQSPGESAQRSVWNSE